MTTIEYITEHQGNIAIDENGSTIYLDEQGRLHRDSDQPAVLHLDGTVEYWNHGLCHRGGGQPAVIRCDGTKLWVTHGVCGRGSKLPAVVHPSGNVEYWQDNVRLSYTLGGTVKRSNLKPLLVTAYTIELPEQDAH